MAVRLHAVDLGVVALYLVAITLFGLRFARKGAAKDRSLRGYFLADKTVPWWAIALSIVSAETSTLTIIGTPGLAFAGDFGFLQIVLGYMCGRAMVALLFLPKYFHGEMLTAYQLIDRRFGKALYKVTAGLFLCTRAAAEGVRVFAVSIVVGIAIGTGDVLSIGIISALTLLYTFEGGMAAVIWTDVVQMAIYVGGTVVAIWSLGHHVPGGWSAIHAIAAPAGKFHMLNFAMNLTTTYTFWAGLLGGTFLTMASHGTDQLMVQRMLAARNLKESRLALLSSGVVIFVQFAMFLLIGVGLWVFYGMHPEGLAAVGGAAGGNRLFPGFIVHEMPRGVAGLLVAAILAAAMSNLSAALNSLSSTTVVDFYMGWRPEAEEKERMLVSRGSTVMWAMVLFAVAVYSVHAGGKGNVVEIGLSIASVAYGCLLGVFLLGTLTRFATQAGAIVGMVTGFVVNLALWQWPGRGVIPRVAWTWYVLIGAAVTFAVGMGASAVLRKKVRVAVAVVGLVMLAAGMALGQQPTHRDEAAMNGAQGGANGAQGGAGGSVAQGPPKQSLDGAPGSVTVQYDFSAAGGAVEKAIGEKKLPGAVLVVGHGGKVVFEQAFGVRKYAGEPGVDGKPSGAEAMTVDTIFDMASLTKCLATATAMMQLVEQGKVDVDAPVVKY
ncbi:MAG: sodium/solute symporter, partial [Acidobacteriota bacterium]|nr:sodium/solute symporter [Acidobacteriota bacterium]